MAVEGFLTAGALMEVTYIGWSNSLNILLIHKSS